MDDSPGRPAPPPSPLDSALEAILRNPAQRSQLNPMQIAEALQKLQQAGWSNKQIIAGLKFSEPHIYQYRKFLGLPQQIQESIRRKELGFSRARELCKLNDQRPDRLEEAFDQIMGQDMSQAETEAYLRSLTKDLHTLTQQNKGLTQIEESTDVKEGGHNGNNGHSGQDSHALTRHLHENRGEIHQNNALTRSVDPTGAPGEVPMDERSTASLVVTVLLSLAFVLPKVFFWFFGPWVSQRFRAFEERCYRRAETVGPINFARGFRWVVTIAAWGLLIFLFWPRICWEIAQRTHPTSAPNAVPTSSN